jgi:hypothetical protein
MIASSGSNGFETLKALDTVQDIENSLLLDRELIEVDLTSIHSGIKAERYASQACQSHNQTIDGAGEFADWLAAI